MVVSNEEPPIGERLITCLVKAGLYQPSVLIYSDVIGLAGELSVAGEFRLDCYCPGYRSHRRSSFPRRTRVRRRAPPDRRLFPARVLAVGTGKRVCIRQPAALGCF